MKVLLFNPRMTAGGITKITMDYVKNFSTNINLEIMTLKVDSDIYIKDTNNKIYEIGTSKFFVARIVEEYKILKKNNYDVIHINGDYCSRIVECISAKLAGCKRIIIHSHNNGISGNFVKHMIHKVAKKLFDFFATDFLACSNSAAQWMFSTNIYKNNKYKIINNGIELDKYKFNMETRKQLQEKLNLKDRMIIGNIGRFEYQKNHAFLIQILNECVKHNKKFVLLLIGNGSLKDSLQEQIRKMNLKDYVYFVESTFEAYKYYNVMDYFVLPSRFEGLGIVNIEAQASGVPTLVSSNVPKEAKVSNLIKFLKLGDGPEKWANEIFNINNNLKERTIAYKSVKKAGYDIKDVVCTLEKIYSRRRIISNDNKS